MADYLGASIGVEGSYTEQTGLWGIAMSLVDDDIREQEDQKSDSSGEDALVVVLPSAQPSRHDDRFVVHEAMIGPEPIRLRGTGRVTVFGINSSFDDTFPSQLVGKVAPEEFHTTMHQVNAVLRKSIPLNLKCFLCGCLCCCCTLGLSLGPVLCFNKRTKARLEKVIAQENIRLYNKLGLHLALSRERSDSTNLSEYVILIHFIPKTSLYRPD